MRFQKHIFVCTNQRKEGERKCCGEVHGLALVAAFKKKIKELQLPVPIRAQRSGCLDACDYGPSVVVYPEGIFYGNVQLQDVYEIVEQHIKNNKPVERLIINFDDKKV